MNRHTSIKLKAAFLLTVFALNTMLAFACSMGVKMGYNDQHHHEAATVKTTAHSHNHRPDTTSQHGEHASPSHHHDKGEPAKDDCCTENALKFQAEDKNFQQSQNTALKAPVFVAFLSLYLGVELAPVDIQAGSRYIIPQYYPPPPDIRLAIQSFLI
jgi:hypothetical protein